MKSEIQNETRNETRGKRLVRQVALRFHGPITGNQQKLQVFMNTQRNLSKALKPHEKTAFVECETAVAEYQHAPFKAGQALQRIRDNRLYREFFPNFAAYCQEKWSISRSTADRLIWAWHAYQLLTPIGVTLENESQARPLLGLATDEIIRAGKLALVISKEKRFSARHFKLAADQVRSPAEKRSDLSKPLDAPTTSVAKALRLVSAAEAAVKQQDLAKVLSALAAIKQCLGSMPEHRRAKQETNPSLTEREPVADKIPSVCSPIDLEESHPIRQDAANHNPAPIAVQQAIDGISAASGFSAKDPKFSDRGVNNSQPLNPNDNVARPARVCLGSIEQPITRWNEVPIFVANWLLAQGQALPSIACIKANPLAFPASARIKQLRGDWFIDVGDGQHKLLRNARLLLQKSGQNHVPITIRLTNGNSIPA